MTVAVYIRKSRPDHPRDSEEETLLRQKEILLDYAREQKLTVGKVYEEVVSGESLAARPQVLQLLEDIKAGQFDAVLCKDIDRLSRGDFEDVGYVHSIFKRHHTIIITPRKTIDLNDETDEEISDFESIIAKYELRNIVHRLQDGVKKSLRDGNYLANAPYGYQKSMSGRHPTLSIQPQESEYIRMIFHLYVHEGLGCQAIADTISSLGAKPRRSEFFSRTSIRKILRNPVYTGKIAWNQTKILEKGTRQKPKGHVISTPRSTWNIVCGKHPALIDESTFERAQQILSSRSHPPCKKGSGENPLSGLVRCKICGKTLQRRPGRKGETVQLICPTRNCVRATALSLVEQALIKQMKADFAPITVNFLPSGSGSGLELWKRAVHSIDKTISMTNLQLNRLSDLLEQGVYPPEHYQERSLVLRARIESLRESRQEVNRKVASAGKAPAVLPEPTTLWDFYLRGSPAQRNRLLKALVDRIDYYKAKDWKPNQFELLIHWKGIL